MRNGIFVELFTSPDFLDAVAVREINGPAPGIVSLSTIAHFQMADEADETWRHPCRIPPTGTTGRSFFKTLFLDVFDFERLSEILGGKIQKMGHVCVFCGKSAFGPCNLISDRWQLSRHGKGGVVVGQRNNGEHGMPLEKYTQATGIEGLKGDPLEDHPYYRDQKTPVRKIDCFTTDRLCVLDRRMHESNFKSKALVAQLIIPSEVESIGHRPKIGLSWCVKVVA